ncbi:hypothetical protein J4442_02355 [Candidatus Woesearchaeota archaeon]|nr:hypothetical protein [Candidatus Woesearchaeota archaeon]
MIVKFLGVMDIIVGIAFILAQWSFGYHIGLILAIYVIIKALIFITDFASIIDLIGGIYLLLIIFGVHQIFAVVFLLWFLQKGFFSLFI